MADRNVIQKQTSSKFQQIDSDGSGNLSSKEFLKFFESEGIFLSESTYQEFFAQIDKDNSGHIDLREFVDFIKISPLTSVQLYTLTLNSFLYEKETVLLAIFIMGPIFLIFNLYLPYDSNTAKVIAILAFICWILATSYGFLAIYFKNSTLVKENIRSIWDKIGSNYQTLDKDRRFDVVQFQEWLTDDCLVSWLDAETIFIEISHERSFIGVEDIKLAIENYHDNLKSKGDMNDAIYDWVFWGNIAFVFGSICYLIAVFLNDYSQQVGFYSTGNLLWIFGMISFYQISLRLRLSAHQLLYEAFARICADIISSRTEKDKQFVMTFSEMVDMLVVNKDSTNFSTETLASLFATLDVDRSGSISCEEFQHFLENYKLNLKKDRKIRRRKLLINEFYTIDFWLMFLGCVAFFLWFGNLVLWHRNSIINHIATWLFFTNSFIGVHTAFDFLSAKYFSIENTRLKLRRYVLGKEEEFQELLDIVLQVQSSKKFQQIDKDGSGTLSSLELVNFFESQGIYLSESIIADFFQQMDKDNSGSIDLNELIEYIKSPPLSSAQLYEITLKELFRDIATMLLIFFIISPSFLILNYYAGYDVDTIKYVYIASCVTDTLAVFGFIIIYYKDLVASIENLRSIWKKIENMYILLDKDRRFDVVQFQEWLTDDCLVSWLDAETIFIEISHERSFICVEDIKLAIENYQDNLKSKWRLLNLAIYDWVFWGFIAFAYGEILFIIDSVLFESYSVTSSEIVNSVALILFILGCISFYVTTARMRSFDEKLIYEAFSLICADILATNETDKEKNLAITFTDMVDMLVRHKDSATFSHETLLNLFRTLDENQNGTISLDEFQIFLTKYRMNEKKSKFIRWKEEFLTEVYTADFWLMISGCVGCFLWLGNIVIWPLSIEVDRMDEIAIWLIFINGFIGLHCAYEALSSKHFNFESTRLKLKKIVMENDDIFHSV